MRLVVALLGVVPACGFEIRPSAGGDDVAGDAMNGGDASGDAAIDGSATVADAAGDASPPTWVAVETLTVPVNGSMVTSQMTLAAGGAYRLRASGTFVIQSSPGTQADAEWWDFSNLMDGVTGVDVGLAVNDTVVDTSRTPKWGAYVATHVYEVPWTGNGQPIVAMLHDGNFANNTGSLTLTILAAQ